MADLETEKRSQGRFGGSPNPGPKAPEPRTGMGAAAPAAPGGAIAPAQETDAPVAEPAPTRPAPAFRVYPGEAGSREVWMLTPDLESTKLGTVNISNEDADKVLGAVGTFNETAGVWDVPEDAAQSLLKGRLGFTDNIIAKFKSGEANMARNALGAAYLSGTMSREDAAARGHEELLKVQLGEQPQLAWNGLGGFAENVLKAFKHPIKALRFATGEFAEQIPILTGSLEAAARGGAKGAAAAGTAAAAAAATGPVGLPIVAGAVSAGAEVGAAYETWKFMSDTEAGSTAMDMLEAGFDDKTIKELAPLAGIAKGTLEMASFSVMTAPLKRGFIAEVLGKDSVKKALSKWYVSYAETIGAEVSTELAQTRVDQLTRNYAAQIEAKPELLLKPEAAKNELWETFVKTAAATMLMGLPGAGVDLILGKKGQAAPRVGVQPAEGGLAPAPKAGSGSPVAPSALDVNELAGASREQIEAGAHPALAFDAGLNEEANYRAGKITVGPKFFNLSPEARRATLAHEIAHELDTRFTSEDWGRVIDAAQRGIFGKLRKDGTVDGVNGQYKPGENVTEVYSLMFEADAELKARYPEARKFVAELAREKGMPLPASVEADFATSSAQAQHVEQLVKGFEAGDVSSEELLRAVEMNPNMTFMDESPSPETEAAAKKVHDWIRDTKPSSTMAGSRMQNLAMDVRQGRVPVDVLEAMKLVLPSSTPDPETGEMQTWGGAGGYPRAFTLETFYDTYEPSEADAKKAPKPSLEERQAEVAQKARMAAIEEKLAGNRELKAVLEPAIARAEKLGQPAVALKNELNRLVTQETSLLQDLEETRTLPAKEAVVRQETLSLKAATLADIVEAGFKEGRAVHKERAAAILEVAKQNGLTGGEVKTLLKSKDIDRMGDREFQNWLDTGKAGKDGKHVPSFRAQASELAQKKAGRAAVGAILERKAIRKEQYIRAFHGLPAINKMAPEQLSEYVRILGAYEQDDEALSPKRRKALETTPFRGAKTWRDVRERAAQILDVPMESLVGSTADQLDVFRYDSSLAERSPVHKVIVEGVKVAELRAAAQFKAFKDKLFDLGAKAFASRERGFLNGRLFAPTMREVMQFLEAENEDKGKFAAALTPEELEFALFTQEAYSKAYDYLVQTGDLNSSRFSDNRYFFHARRPVSEMVAGLAKGEKLTNIIKELLSKWKQDEVAFKVTDDTGKVLGLRKFFKQTLFRSGELTPSENVIRSTQRYFESFYKKVALDDMVPHLETLVMSLRSAAEVGDEQAQVRQASLERFTKHYLNAKKGHSILQSVIPQGGKIDAAIRLLSNYVSINAIALNIPLQIASKVGEQIPLYQVLGAEGRLRAFKRSLTAQGKAILAAHEHFTGESVVKQAFEPGRNIEDHLGVILYGIISSNRASAMQTLLLGSMTDEEFKAGKVSAERLAEIKTVAGRWLDVSGSKSIFGSTSTGAALMKFHGWAAPIMRTTIKDLDDIQASLRGKKTLTPQEKALILSDVSRAAQSAAIVAALYAWAASDPDDGEDDSFIGKLRKYALRETTTMLQAMDPVLWVTAGPVAGFAFQLAKNLRLLLTLAEYEADTAEHSAGDLRGPAALKRQLTPALVRQFQDKGKE